ncbi:hypothetical protein IKN40_07890 [bacterium]|nr:hypothetical protein [bacterium]
MQDFVEIVDTNIKNNLHVLFVEKNLDETLIRKFVKIVFQYVCFHDATIKYLIIGIELNSEWKIS